MQKFFALTEPAFVPGGGDRLIAAAMRLADRLTAWDFGGVLRAVVRCPPPTVYGNGRTDGRLFSKKAIARNGPMSEKIIS